MIEIRRISSTETYDVRHPVLRKGMPRESCAFTGDDDEQTVHFGLFEDGLLVGIVSVFSANHENFAGKQVQLRGMAVLESHQGKGFGKMLIREAEKHAAGSGVEFIWFNARINAVGFYQKMGYSIVGDAFDIPNIGIHYIMYRKL